MSYARRNSKNIAGSIVAVVLVTALAVWQFYQFVTSPGGSAHLWWAIALGLLACTAAFMVFLVFVHHDAEDDLHITSPHRL